MALETGTYISDLVVTNPPGSDPKSQMDDHLRLIKSTIKTTFPSVTGAITKTHTELNSVTDRGLIAGQTWTGTHDFPATTYGVTASFGSTGTAYATLDYVNAVSTNAALPGQSLGLLISSGTVASFSKSLNFALNLGKAADVASASTPDIWSGNGNTSHITGTTTLTGFAAAPQAGAWRTLYFDGACLLTNGANFVVQGGANYTTAAGDVVDVYADTTTKFYLFPRRANGKQIAGLTMNMVVLTTTQGWVAPVASVEVTVQNGGQGGFQSAGGTPSAMYAGGTGGDAGVKTLTLTVGATYTATIGSGTAAAVAPAVGGPTTFAGTGITTLTSANADLRIPGGGTGFFADNTSPGKGGGSYLSPANGSGYGAGGLGGNGNSTGQPGVNGAVVIRYMS